MAHIGGIKADIESVKAVVQVKSPRQRHYGTYGQL